MMKIIRLIFQYVSLCSVALLASCYYKGEPSSDAWDLTQRQIDSLSFYSTHHYTENFNFIVKGDSLSLMSMPIQEGTCDTLVVRRGGRVVVADIQRVVTDTIDSVWVKLAHDQECQGWVRESTMLETVTPDDPVSIFIDAFSDLHILLFLALVVIVLAAYGLRKLMRRNVPIVHFRDIDSPFPMILTLLVASAAAIYATIQLSYPEIWRHFYYHPSLNPFTLPPQLGLLISTVWAIIIITVAAVDDVFHHLTFSDAMLYLLGLAAVCAIDYILFSVLTLYYIGYPVLVIYLIFALRRYRRQKAYLYICGKCGARLKSKGKCPECGAIND